MKVCESLQSKLVFVSGLDASRFQEVKEPTRSQTSDSQQLTLNMFTKHSHLGLQGLIMGTPPIGRCGIRRSPRNRFWVAHATPVKVSI